MQVLLEKTGCFNFMAARKKNMGQLAVAERGFIKTGIMCISAGCLARRFQQLQASIPTMII